jgi:transposase IS66 family protein/transposase IS66-like protein
LRRKFFDIAKGGSAPIATEALERIAALYAIEKTIRGRSADERRAVRQENSKPLVLALKIWLEEQLARVSGKSVIAEAIGYGLNHWDGLTRFLEDGRIELDTNIVERGMRPIVLNRKNALFAGHDQGAENWAAIASLVETCKLHGVDPQSYFADVLTSSSISGQPRASTSSCLGLGGGLPIASRLNRECDSGPRSIHRKIKPSEQWNRKTAFAAPKWGNGGGVDLDCEVTGHVTGERVTCLIVNSGS